MANAEKLARESRERALAQREQLLVAAEEALGLAHALEREREEVLARLGKARDLLADPNPLAVVKNVEIARRLDNYLTRLEEADYWLDSAARTAR